MRETSLLEMLQHGVHFGHQQSRRHPKMDPFIFTTRGGISVINLEKTKVALTQASAFVRDLVANGGSIVFVGTKKQAREIVQQAALQAAMPYVVDRWIGGLFTNFGNVRELIKKLHRLKQERMTGDWNKYTKKEQLDLQEEVDRLEKLVGGVASLERLPDAIFVVDVKNEKTAIREATKTKIPVVAMCDTNINPAPIQYVIPANDDATKSIAYVCNVLVEAVQAGRAEQEKRLLAQARAVAEAAAAPAVTQ